MPPTTKFTFSPKPDQIPEIAQLLLKPLSEQADEEIVDAGFNASVNYKGSAPVGDIEFGLGLETKAGIDVYNAANDKDPDGVFSAIAPRDTVREVKPGEFKKLTLPAVLQYKDDTEAWAKYRFEAKPNVKASIKPPAGFKFKIDGSIAAVFADYHRHNSADNTGTAIASDLGSLRYAGSKQHITDLPAGDALYYQVRGVLETSMSFRWSDTFAFAIADLSRLLGPGQSMSIEVGTSVSVDIKYALEDDFRISFSKHTDDRVKVAVLKSENQTLGVKVGASLTAGFADPDQAAAALKTLFTAFLGSQLATIDNAVSKIDALVKKLDFNDLTDTQKKIATFLAERLGLVGEGAPINEVKAAWNDIKKKWVDIRDYVPDLIDKAVRIKASLAFKYEYLRTDKEEELAVAYLTNASLGKVHKDLMLLRLDSLLTEAHKNGNELITHFRQLERVRRHAWGFTLSAGPWQIMGQDLKEVKTVLQETKITGTSLKRLALNALRGYKDNLNGDEHQWLVDLKADMDEFGVSIDYKSLDYGLHFKYYTSERTITKKELRRGLDYSLLWDSLSNESLEAQVTLMSKDSGKKGELTVEITVGDDELRDLCRLIKGLSDDQRRLMMAKSLAQSMSTVDGREPYRGTPEARSNYYLRLWLWAFNNPNPGYTAIRTRAFQEFRNTDMELANWERLGGQGTFVEHFEHHKRFHSNVNAFFKGMDRLSDLLEKSDPGQEWDGKPLNKAFKSIRDMFDRALYARAAGTFLLMVAGLDDDVYREIKTVTTVEFSKGNDPKTFLLGANAVA